MTGESDKFGLEFRNCAIMRFLLADGVVVGVEEG
jgi:hypothetical protein